MVLLNVISIMRSRFISLPYRLTVINIENYYHEVSVWFCEWDSAECETHHSEIIQASNLWREISGMCN